ncbi:BZ3500_MvSof-1268-A1-R1_Chr1-3g02342 [Microbotryum saponariae]|uniref:BZ3500_MvSof-1268-A1-R1_Chr1-3g02342 protein n=1 Tax=Microbotryum saponariae TaxID=289078 RepID=A0A2X0KD80_9BASI|nr:BZ3500_MvSof-1268-A1-R1_Chr1-3g02342 [Microbotryum saponariae]SCZ96047.1 BZ3501_MvSof-1269-A2-R1_Chr1-3g01945 [Microbotryum saponariae]
MEHGSSLAMTASRAATTPKAFDTIAGCSEPTGYARPPQSDSAQSPRPLSAGMQPSAMHASERECDSKFSNHSSAYSTYHPPISSAGHGPLLSDDDVLVPRRHESGAAATLISFGQRGNYAHQDDPHASMSASAWYNRVPCSTSAASYPTKPVRAMSSPVTLVESEPSRARSPTASDPLPSVPSSGWFSQQDPSRSADPCRSNSQPEVEKPNALAPKRPPNAWICYRTARFKAMRAEGAPPLPQAAIYYSYQPTRKLKSGGTPARSGRRVSSSKRKERRSTAPQLEAPTPEQQAQLPSDPTMVPTPDLNPEDTLVSEVSAQKTSRWIIDEYNGLGGGRHSASFEDARGSGALSSRSTYSQSYYDISSSETHREDEEAYEYLSMYEVSTNHQQRTWYVPTSAPQQPIPCETSTTARYFHADPCLQPVLQASMARSLSFAPQHLHLLFPDHRSASCEPAQHSPTAPFPVMYAAGPAYMPEASYHPWQEINLPNGYIRPE